jgi:hypothetical protein
MDVRRASLISMFIFNSLVTDNVELNSQLTVHGMHAVKSNEPFRFQDLTDLMDQHP